MSARTRLEADSARNQSQHTCALLRTYAREEARKRRHCPRPTVGDRLHSTLICWRSSIESPNHTTGRRIHNNDTLSMNRSPTVFILMCAVILGVSLCVRATPPVRPGTGKPSPRLPRTSASQLSQLNSSNGTAGTKNGTAAKGPGQRNGNLRTR